MMFGIAALGATLTSRDRLVWSRAERNLLTLLPFAFEIEFAE